MSNENEEGLPGIGISPTCWGCVPPLLQEMRLSTAAANDVARIYFSMVNCSSRGSRTKTPTPSSVAEWTARTSQAVSMRIDYFYRCAVFFANCVPYGLGLIFSITAH